MIFLGADHRGYDLKEKVAKWLFEWKYEFSDMGAVSLEPHDDYSHYAERVASLVGRSKNDMGVLVCGSGVGMGIAANKFDGARAAIGKNPAQVRAGRNDDDMNILVFASDFTKDEEVREMLKVFLQTKFAGKARYEKRLQEISEIEANN